MNVGDILRRYLTATSGFADAHDERWDHLNHAHQVVAHTLELPELYVPNAEVTTTASQDWIAMDCEVYSILGIVDKTTADKLNPEPGGFAIRQRYYETGQARPALGVPHFYILQGNRIYLRDTPEDARVLLVSFRAQPPTWTDDSVDDHPVTPSQYDMPIIKLATASFYELHPPTLPDGSGDYQRASMLRQQAMGSVGEQQPAMDNDRDRSNQWTMMRGYEVNVSGR
jgi:hypothetical protein